MVVGLARFTCMDGVCWCAIAVGQSIRSSAALFVDTELVAFEVNLERFTDNAAFECPLNFELRLMELSFSTVVHVPPSPPLNN